MSRDIPFDPDQQCDDCSAIGAYDFYGDFLCDDCANGLFEEDIHESVSSAMIRKEYK